MPTALPATRGMHRWIWNLHYPDPDTTTRGYPISAVPHATPQEPQGPLALPGNYVIRLTVDGHPIEAPLSVKPDPRVTSPAGALQKQFELASSLAGSLSETSRTLMAARSEHEQLQELLKKRPTDEVIAGFDRRLLALLSAKEEPSEGTNEAHVLLSDVQSQIEILYKQVIGGDAAPTAAQLSACEAVQKKAMPLLATWNQLQKELPALNKRLSSARLAAVRPELPAPRDLNVADEE